jgi:hypothetical protein
MKLRTYSELSRLSTIEERYEYLKLGAQVAQDTFGYDRYLNQEFYRSRMWRSIRKHVIARDMGCDLGVEGFEIHDRVYVHHMNPMTPGDILDGSDDILDIEFLVCVTFDTHNAIHYGTVDHLRRRQLVERRPGDTTPWKQIP